MLLPAICGIWRNLYGQRSQIKFTLYAQTSDFFFVLYRSNCQIFQIAKNKAKCFYYMSYIVLISTFLCHLQKIYLQTDHSVILVYTKIW